MKRPPANEVGNRKDYAQSDSSQSATPICPEARMDCVKRWDFWPNAGCLVRQIMQSWNDGDWNASTQNDRRLERKNQRICWNLCRPSNLRLPVAPAERNFKRP